MGFIRKRKAGRFILPVVLLGGFLLAHSMPQTLADTDAEPPFKIAVVSVKNLLDKAPQARLASEKLKKEYGPREKELDDEQDSIQRLQDEFDKQVSLLSDDDKLQKERDLRSRQRTLSRKLEDFRDELRAARDTAMESVQNQIFQAIEEVREGEQIDVVLKESDYIAASKRVDITQKVLEHLRQKTTTGQPPLPSSGEEPPVKEQ